MPGLAGLDPIVWFGILNAGALLLALVVAHPLVRRFERAGKEGMVRSLLGLDAALIAGTLVFAFAGSFLLAVLAFWAIEIARSLSNPVWGTWLNANIDDSRVRATVISITNLGDSRASGAAVPLSERSGRHTRRGLRSPPGRPCSLRRSGSTAVRFGTPERSPSSPRRNGFPPSRLWCRLSPVLRRRGLGRTVRPGLFAFKEVCMAAVEQRGRAKSDPEARQAVLRRVKEEEVGFVHLWFNDIEGHLKSFAVTLQELEGALDDGMGFDGSSITGFNAIEESDMVAIPDPHTFQLMPNGGHKVARMICDVVTPEGEPYVGDPRHVLRLALERMKTMGFDTFNVGPELEYFLFASDDGTETLDEGGYFAMTTMDAASDLRHDTVRALESMGIPIEYVHHEVGPSQHEIDMQFAPALEMADHTITYRLIVKEIAKKAGYHATFMPKPIFGENGSGMHTHQSLFAEGKNAFFDEDDDWHLSDVGKGFIAGQLRHAREISAVFAQWVNSYKRLVPGYEAPVYAAWSRRNRSALIRIPLYKPGNEQATRAEIRCPDPACNPYLTFAALLHAGLEGIEQGYELPPPMESNLYKLTAEERKDRGIVALPETLGEAIDELSASELARKALGDHIFDNYVKLKRQEWDDYRVQLTPWEMEKYLPAL